VRFGKHPFMYSRSENCTPVAFKTSLPRERKAPPILLFSMGLAMTGDRRFPGLGSVRRIFGGLATGRRPPGPNKMKSLVENFLLLRATSSEVEVWRVADQGEGIQRRWDAGRGRPTAQGEGMELAEVSRDVRDRFPVGQQVVL